MEPEGNRACSTVTQPTAPPRVPLSPSLFMYMYPKSNVTFTNEPVDSEFSDVNFLSFVFPHLWLNSFNGA